MKLDPELLAVLVCPKCRGGLDILGDTEGLSCAKCAVVYPVRDEIPIMLAEEAVPAREWQQGQRDAAVSGAVGT